MEGPGRRRKGRDGEHRGGHVSDAGTEGYLGRLVLSNPSDVVPRLTASALGLRRAGAAHRRRERKMRGGCCTQRGANNAKCRIGDGGTNLSLLDGAAGGGRRLIGRAPDKSARANLVRHRWWRPSR